MRLIFLGSSEFAIPTLRWLAESEHEVAMVVTQPARTAGRGRRVTPTPVHALSKELGLEVFEAEDVNDSQAVSRIQSVGARLGLAISFGQKLGPELLATLPSGCVNLHASLLPKYRGAAPINWALVHGEQRTGVTVFKIVQRMDAGPILTSRWSMIKPEETAGELHDRLAAVGVDAVQAAFALYEGDADPEGAPQVEAEATKAPKLTKKGGIIDFDRPAEAVANHIRGMTPWPGARTCYESKNGRWENVAIIRARKAESPEKPAVAPGTIDARRYVAVADGFLEVLELKPSSGRTMTWPEYVNGRHVCEGDKFVAPS